VTSWPGAERCVVEDAFTTSRSLPQTIEPEIDESFRALCSFRVPERSLVKIPNARLRSLPGPGGPVGLVVLPDTSFVGELVALTAAGRRSVLHEEPSYRERLPRRPPRMDGNFYAFLGLGVYHYYHWSHDLVMGSRGIADLLPRDAQIVVPDPLRQFQMETLALLGLDDHPRIPFPAGECWELENLYVVTPRLKTQIDSVEPFCWFREAAMSRYGVREVVPTRRLYLSRRDDTHWRTTNEHEVETLLAHHGFQTVMPGRLSFREQIELFGEAEVIVGTGAGLFNMVFSPPATKVLQFQERTHIVHALWTEAAALGIDYHYVLGDTVPNPDAANADIHMPTDKLQASLRAMRLA
jgi:capsular polysaccharide biosynthesis protein